MSDNDLESVSLDKLPQLEQLWLNANKLTKVDVSKNTNLRVLNVVGKPSEVLYNAIAKQ